MGLLLGDVTVKAAASNFLCFTRHSTCCPPCSKATAMLEVMDKELCFFVQDEPGQGSTAYISAMVPQIRADRRKVQPPLPLCWEGAFVPCEDLIKVATALTPCLSGLCLSEGPSKASAPCLQRAPRPSGCSTHCPTGPRAPAGPRGGQPGAAGRGGGRGRRAQRARRRAHARRRLGAQPPVRPACAARPAAEQLAVQLAAAPASNGACGFPSCCLAGTFTKSNTLAMEARERDFNICLCVLSMRSCRCAPVPRVGPSAGWEPSVPRTYARADWQTYRAGRARRHITVLPSHVDLATQAAYQQLDASFVGLIVAAFDAVRAPARCSPAGTAARAGCAAGPSCRFMLPAVAASAASLPVARLSRRQETSRPGRSLLWL